MYNYVNVNNLKEPAQSESSLLSTYKDSVFRKIFNNRENALELYNALTGQELPPDAEIYFTTLEDVIYKTRKNDISFLLDNAFIILFEHQSTVNNNMTTRDLIYYATTIQRMFDNKKFYNKSKVILPRPEFIMLYNGTENMPDYCELKLSDNFAGEGEINLQLTVKVYNINEGRNPVIMKRCKILEQYSRFVSAVREAAKQGEPTDRELKQIFQQCIEQGILPDFLKEYGTEGINMLFEELTEEEAIELAREDGIEIGHQAGVAEGEARVNQLYEMLYEQNRNDDVYRAITDSEYRLKLFKELGLLKD